MTARPSGPLRINSGNWAFIAVVVAALVVTFSVPTPYTVLELILLTTAVIVYTLLGIYWQPALIERAQKRPIIAYFAVQIAVGGVLLFASRMNAWLIVLPLVGHAVAMLSRRGVLLVAVALLLSVLGVMLILGAEARGLLQMGVSFSAAMIFVGIFIQIAISEERARARGEQLTAELAAANRQLGEYAVQAEELAINRERNRLAREIHDSLGHYLTVINVQIGAARTLLARDPTRALDALNKAQTLTQEGLADVRRSVAALRANPTENRPLPDAIAALTQEAQASGLQVQVTILGTPRPLSPQVELTLYRAVQEGLTNVRKHAQAQRVEITLEYLAPEGMRLAMRDDGIGAAQVSGGFGLLGLQERVKILGGRMEIETAPGAGLGLTVHV